MHNSRLAHTSLRLKVTLAIIIPMVLILGGMSLAVYFRQRSVLLGDLSVLASASSQLVQENLIQLMRASAFDDVQALLTLVGDTEEFETANVFQPNGEVIYAAVPIPAGMRLDEEMQGCAGCHPGEYVPLRSADIVSADATLLTTVITSADGSRLFRSIHPLDNGPDCQGCHETDDTHLGFFLADISMVPVDSALADGLRTSLLWSLLSIAIVALGINVVLDTFLFRRLHALEAAISRFGRGQAVGLPPGQKDEIGRLEDTFHEMSAKIDRRRREINRLTEQLRQRSLQQDQLFQRVIASQENERRRIARELHDNLGQILSGLSLRAEVLGRLIAADPARAEAQIADMQALVASLTTQLYDIMLDLRPSALDDLGLVSALRVTSERQFRDLPAEVDLDTEAFDRRLAPEVETAVFRILQEAMSNAARHAAAANVTVSLTAVDGMFYGKVCDDGAGFDLDTIRFDGTSPRGLGIMGMQERAAHCGGNVTVDSAPGSGTCVTLSIPLEETDFE